jgi:hypothetical protein
VSSEHSDLWSCEQSQQLGGMVLACSLEHLGVRFEKSSVTGYLLVEVRIAYREVNLSITDLAADRQGFHLVTIDILV